MKLISVDNLIYFHRAWPTSANQRPFTLHGKFMVLLRDIEERN